MQRALVPGRSPTPALILGLIITLAAVVAYSAYITRKITGLRELQNNLVARNRYRWFGKRDVCMVPTPELRARFID